MKIYIDNKEYEFTNEELDLMYLDQGEESIVYKYSSIEHGNIVLKIYKDYCKKYRLSEDLATMLSHINTKRLHLPKGNIYNENKIFFGYYDNYIKWNSPLLINDMKMENFLHELELINNDLIVLSKHFIKIEDLSRSNLNYNNGLHLIDPGSYYQVLLKEMSDLMNENIKIVNKFIINDIFCYVPGLTYKNEKLLEHHFEDIDYIGNFIVDEALSNETVKSYVKRICT